MHNLVARRGLAGYAVQRTGVGRNLPVYRDIRNGGTQVFTKIRRIEGDVEALARDLQQERFEGEPAGRMREWKVRPDLGQLWVKGDHLATVLSWLTSKGF